MPLYPQRVKYRKAQRGSRKGFPQRGTSLSFGEYGLQSLGRAWVDTKQIEAARVALSRHTKRRGKYWTRIYPDLPITKKPLETRMGKGKGPPESWVAVVRPGNMLFEIVGVPEVMAKEALRLAASKLPIPCKFVKR